MSFTRETALGFLILAGVGLSLFLFVGAFLARRRGDRKAEPLIRAVIGLTLIGAVAATRWTETLEAGSLQLDGVSGPLGVVIAIAAIFVGAAVGDYVFGRLVPLVSARIRSKVDSVSANWARATVNTLAGIVAVGVFFYGLNVIDPSVGGEVGAGSGLDIELVATFELPDAPRDLAFLDSRSGFISLPDSVAHFRVVGDISDGQLELSIRTSKGDVTNPRGIAVSDNFLFVSDQGDADGDAPEGLDSTKGAVVRFDIGPSGDLTNRTVVLGDIPIVGFLHGINGLAIGPDGLVYVSIGNSKADIDPSVPNSEWLGTILRFTTDGNEIEVFARGLRNVYDIEFDSDGRLWGVDNDGPTRRGYRAEEVLQIRKGAHFGYPFEGTYGPYEVRTDSPIGAFTGADVEGTAGIELAENLNIGQGLLIGARVLHFFPFSEDAKGLYSSGEFDRQGDPVIFARQGYFTVVEATEEGLLFAGVDGLSLQSNLYVLRISN